MKYTTNYNLKKPEATDLVSISDLNANFDTIDGLLDVVLKKDGVEFSSWGDVQRIVRSGFASKFFSIGDQFVSTKGDKQLVWDIIGIDQDTPADSNYTHSLTIQMHDCYNSLQFKAPEALYYAATGLVAGTYNFTLLSDYNSAYNGGKTHQFTLTKAVPAGGQLMFPCGWYAPASTCKVSSYESAKSTTAIETVGVTEGNGGTSLGTADGETTNMNHTYRLRCSFNKWSQSALRQWLNSDKAAGAWWTAQNNFDRPPTYAATTAGFLSDMDSEFLSAIGKVKKRTAKNTVIEGGGYTDSEELMFLLSKSEVYACLENNINEGEPYAYYKNNSDLSSASDDADTNRIKYLNGSAIYWWLRSPHSGHMTYYVQVLEPTGRFHGAYNATSTFGVAPACCII